MMFFRMSRLVRFLCVIMKDSRGYTTLRQNGGYAALTLQRPNLLTSSLLRVVEKKAVAR